MSGDYPTNCRQCGKLLDDGHLRGRTWSGGVPELCSCQQGKSKYFLRKERTQNINSPTIVCLCGSTKYYEEFLYANARETLAGNIVLSVGYFGHRPELYPDDYSDFIGEMKEKLDELHKRKIDMADEVLIIDKNGYIGESTKSEIKYAMSLGKTIKYYSKEYAQNYKENYTTL